MEQLTEVNLTRNEWQKHPTVIDTEATCMFDIDYLRRVYFMDPEGYQSRVVAYALWQWLLQWKQNNWQHRGKQVWTVTLREDTAALIENIAVKVHHVGNHIPKSHATEEHQNNQQVDWVAKI